MNRKDQLKSLYSSSNFSEFLIEVDKQDLNLANDIDLLELKGSALQKEGRFEEAMGIWNVLITENPNNSTYFGERGVCKFQLGFKSSTDDLDEAVRLDPDDPYHWACRAFIKDKTGDIKGAIDDYEKAAQLEPDNEVTLNNLGMAHEKLGYQKKAHDYYTEVDKIIGRESPNYVGEPAQEKQVKPRRSDLLREVRKMLSSPKEFASFLRELFRK